MPVKLPVFCLVACVRMRYFTCAHQPAFTGSVMWWEPFVTDSLASASSRGDGARVTGIDRAGVTEGISLDGTGRLNLLGAVTRDHGVVSKDTAMFAKIVQRMTAPFRRKRCPECGHKLRETYCDVCGYELIEQTRDKLLRYRRGPA